MGATVKGIGADRGSCLTLEGRIGMTLFLLASGRIASAQDRWELVMRGEIGIPQGYVQVRENEIQGTHLDLRHDLGIETSESFGLEVVRRLRSGSDLRLSVNALLLYGSTTLPGDVFFNGATLQGGTRLETRPFFLRVNALYERTLAHLADGGSVAAGVGFSYVLLDFRLQGTLAATTRDAETSEASPEQRTAIKKGDFRPTGTDAGSYRC